MTRNPLRALILGNYCSANRGDAAILSGLIALLREAFPDIEITVSSFFPELAEAIHGVSTILPLLKTGRNYDRKAYEIQRKWAIRYAKRILRPIAALRLSEPLRNALDVLAAADLVIGAGGTYINDNYRPAIIGRLHELSLAKTFGKPVILLGHSVGPFVQDEFRHLAGEVLSLMDAIGVRDEASVEVLADIGVSGNRVTITGDTAYFAPVVAGQDTQAIAKQVIPDFGSSPLVSVSVRQWGFYSNGDQRNAHEQYVTKMASVCDHIVAKHKARVVFLSTCTSLGGYWTDDRVVAAEVLSRMKTPEQTTIVQMELTAGQLSGLYGLMNLHVGTRLHSVILAAMAGTPSVAVAYEFKTHEFMRQIGLDEYMVEINSFTERDLIGRIDRALENRDTLLKEVAQQMTLVGHRGRKNLDLVRQVLKKVKW